MSARTKKSTSQQRTSTPARMASPSRNRPPSPNWITRVQEKDELASLNDRLANYIQKVMSLETENARLTKVLTTQEETVKTETTKIKTLYEGELNDARKVLDSLAKDKAQLQIENGALREENANLKSRLAEAERNLHDKEKRLLAAESQVNELQARLNDSVNQRKHWESEYNRMRKEKESLDKRVREALNKLEEETLRRVDLENKLTSTREELDFTRQIHEQELSETINRTQITVEEVDGRLQDEYQDKLAQALREMRDSNDESLRNAREESEDVYGKQLDNLREQLEKSSDAGTRSKRELAETRRQLDEMSSGMTKIQSQLATYEARIRDLEAQLTREQEEHQRAVEDRDGEIRHLRQTLDDRMEEYRDLLEIKIKLDAEITSYRRMLEGEEARLNLSQTSDLGSPRPASTPGRSLLGSSRKRRTLDRSGAGPSKRQMHSASRVDFAQTSSSTGHFEVSETDTEGKFVRLTNTSDKDQSLGGWQVKHVAGPDKETTFKFHRSLSLKPGATVTVWGSESGATHSPPTDIVMKGQKLFVGDEMKTSLLNPQAEEVASRELKRSMLRTTEEYEEADDVQVAENWLHQQGDPKDKCVVM